MATMLDQAEAHVGPLPCLKCHKMTSQHALSAFFVKQRAGPPICHNPCEARFHSNSLEIGVRMSTMGKMGRVSCLYIS